MSIVFDAFDLRTKTHRALKILKTTTAVDPTFVLRFQREAQLLDAIDHPAIVRVIDSGLTDDGSLFLVMEKLEGETLHEFFKRESPLPLVRMVPIIEQIASALEAVHQREIVHRDLKPSNVFVTRDPSYPIKLIDFGLAKIVADPKLTKTGEIMGTPHFMAPEQLLSSKTVDARADVFALAVLAYGGLTGRVPYAGETLDALRATLEGNFVPLLQMRPSLDPAVAKVVEGGLAPQPENRCPSARAFAIQLRAAADGRGFIPSKNIDPTVRFDSKWPPPPPDPIVPVAAGPSLPPRAERRLGLPIAIGVIVAVAIAAGGAAALLATERSEPLARVEPPAEPVPAPAPSPGPQGTTVTVMMPNPPAVSKVRVSTEPEGALAEAEGALVGTTPIDIERPTEGSRSIQLSYAGYESSSVLLMPTSPDEVHVHLRRSTELRAERDRRPRDRIGYARDPEMVVSATTSDSMALPVAEPAMETGHSDIVCPWCGARGHCEHLDPP
jgi:serine/threonine-protein kinase